MCILNFLTTNLSSIWERNGFVSFLQSLWQTKINKLKYRFAMAYITLIKHKTWPAASKMHLRCMPCKVSKSKQFCVVQSFLVARTGGSSLCLGIFRCSWHRGPCVLLIDNTHMILEATARDVPQHVQMFFWCGINCKQMQDEATF